MSVQDDGLDVERLAQAMERAASRLTIEHGGRPIVPGWSVAARYVADEYGSPAIGLDVITLASALDNVDRNYERGWTPAHYARAIVAEYNRLVGPE